MRQRGKRLVSEDGLSLGFEQQDLIDWLTFWDNLRKPGAVLPADVTAATQTLPENSPLVMGQAPIEFTTASQFVNFQGLQPHTLGLRMYPNGPEGSEPAQFIRPALYISAAAPRRTRRSRRNSSTSCSTTSTQRRSCAPRAVSRSRPRCTRCSWRMWTTQETIEQAVERVFVEATAELG